jgi:hypothetical protein
MFEFIYKGRFDCLITKGQFEAYVENMYYNMKKILKVKWSPAKFVVTMEIDPTRPKGIGGTTDYDRKSDIIFRLHLQLLGFPKKEQTFDLMEKMFDYTLRHEMFHFFLPSVKDNSCWSEGVTDFMTHLFKHGSTNANLTNALTSLTVKYRETTDEHYKMHLYGYMTGFKKMLSLYRNDPSCIDDVFLLIQDHCKNDATYKKEYTAADIKAYNSDFKTFFVGRCNKHFIHVFK